MARFSRIAGLGIMLSAAASCRDSLTKPDFPAVLAGTYVLQTVSGKPADRVSYPGVLGDYAVVADTLQFVDDRPVDGPYFLRSIRIIRVTALGSGTDTTYRFVSTPAYVIRNGNHIEIGRFTPCPPDAICVPNDTGVVMRDGLQIWRAGFEALDPWIYTRVEK